MIDLSIPGGRYSIWTGDDQMGLKNRISEMNDMFTKENNEPEKTAQVADEQPRAPEVKETKKEKDPEKMADTETLSSKEVIISNLEQDVKNITEDIEVAKALLVSADGDIVKKLTEENEKLKTQVKELESKVAVLDALKSMLGK